MKNLKSYVLLEYKNGPFQWLQSVEEPSVAFVVCAPDFLGLVYSAPDAKKKLINLERDEDLVVLNIVSFNREKGGHTLSCKKSAPVQRCSKDRLSMDNGSR